MNLNFSGFRLEKTANTKVGHTGPLGQSFDFRFKQFMSNKKDDKTGVTTPKEDSFFELSIVKFNQLGLHNLGMIQTVSPEGVSYLAVVDNDNATLLKRNGKNEKGEKGKKFKSTIIEQALSIKGVISLDAIGKTQRLELVLVPDSEGATLGDGPNAIKTYGVYEVKKSTDESGAEDDEKATGAINSGTATAEQTKEEATSTQEEGAATNSTNASTTSQEEEF